MKKAVEILMIVDKSGSMQSIRNDVIGGFNTFLAEQQKNPDPANLTLVCFDTAYQVPIKAAPLSSISPLTEANYIPSGSTALLDAIGKSLTELKARIAVETPVVVVVMTDGEENASHEWSKAAIKSLVDDCIKTGWTFQYLGANQDSFAEASKYGMANEIGRAHV